MKRKSIRKESLNEGLYDRFIDGFFGALKKGVADSFQKQAEKQGLPDHLIAHMDKMNKEFKDFKDAMDKLKKNKK